MLEQQYIMEFCKFLTRIYSIAMVSMTIGFDIGNDLERPLQIFSLWCVSPRYKDGLGYSTNDVGSVLAFSGMFSSVLACLASSYIRAFVSLKLTHKYL